MSLRMTVAAALICAANAVSAATFTAVFETPALLVQGAGPGENPNNVVSMTVSDVASGVEIRVVNIGSVDSIGSVFLSGLSAASFTSPENILDTEPTNAYRTRIEAGVVFSLGLAPGQSLVASTVPGETLTATDIAAAIVGTITFNQSFSDLALYRGAFEPTTVGVVPLPATLPLLAAALVGVAAVARRKA
jgi:hypothetical protein